MSPKPTLTQRVTRLEENAKRHADAIKSQDQRTAYTEINTVQLAEDARKARQDAKSASIIAAAALILLVFQSIVDLWGTL